ncbi:MAG TPA: enoyl-CoA hydratase/isomerase family protein [Gemmatimonadota bacterium]|nr:enoyl-CoA hydratase/isomerase family protein [Gemmatimonadota bacterium]
MNDSVRYEVHDTDGVATITLDRPEKRNALDPDAIDGLEAAFAAAEAEDRARVLFVNGSGKDFCAGADIMHIEALVDATREALVADARRLGRLFVRMRRLPKPIVAAVHGNALAGGAGLATACDIVLASDDAHFGYPEIHIGFVPAMVMTMLVRCVGEKRAFELVTSGRRVGAEEAIAMGLVHCVYSRHTFADDSRAYAVELAARSATSLAMSKCLLYEIDEMTFEEGIERGAQVNADARQTEDCRAAVRAFLSRKIDREGP